MRIDDLTASEWVDVLARGGRGFYVGGREGERCGRLTKRGKPCTGHRVPVLGHYIFPSCRAHMTSLEISARDAMEIMDKVSRIEHQRSVVPACWSWELPDWLVEPDDLCAVADWQDGRCAICGGRGPLVEDHDHKTSFTRGWLCHSCNVREGLSSPDQWVFRRYRHKNPASMFGVRVAYVDMFGREAVPEPDEEDLGPVPDWVREEYARMGYPLSDE